jgi:hypothetical protein
MSRHGRTRFQRRQHERRLQASERALVHCEEAIAHAELALKKAKRSKSASAVDTAAQMLLVLRRQHEHLTCRLAELRGTAVAA